MKLRVKHTTMQHCMDKNTDELTYSKQLKVKKNKREVETNLNFKKYLPLHLQTPRRDGRVVDCGGLENR